MVVHCRLDVYFVQNTEPGLNNKKRFS